MKKVVFFVLAIFVLPLGLKADTVLPKQIDDIFKLLGPQGTGASTYVVSRIQLVLLIALGVVVLASVAYALMAAIKYIGSQGDSGKMEEAQKAIKAIFFGIAAMLIAIVGIVLVFVIFGTSPINPSVYQTCFQAPESAGCDICKESGTDDAACKMCENLYKELQSPIHADKTRQEIIDYFISWGNHGGHNCINPIDGGKLPANPDPAPTPTPPP